MYSEPCEIGEEAIWESRFTSFFNVIFEVFRWSILGRSLHLIYKIAAKAHVY